MLNLYRDDTRLQFIQDGINEAYSIFGRQTRVTQVAPSCQPDRDNPGAMAACTMEDMAAGSSGLDYQVEDYVRITVKFELSSSCSKFSIPLTDVQWCHSMNQKCTYVVSYTCTHVYLTTPKMGHCIYSLSQHV